MRFDSSADRPTIDTRLTVRTQGHVADEDVQYAREKVLAALRTTGLRVLFVRIRLAVLADPAVSKPAIVHVTVDLRGRPIQIRGVAATLHEAVDEAHDRLRERLRRTAAHWQAIRGRQPSDEPHQWRHGQQRPAPDESDA